MRRPTILALLLIAACVNTDPESPGQLPEGYISYEFEPSTMNYTFVDTTAGNDMHLKYVPVAGFRGTNCIGLSPRTGPDTTGQFAFVHIDANTGRMERLNHGVLDTITMVMLLGTEGTHGTYAITSTGHLNLHWADGSLAGGGIGNGRFFASQSVIRFSPDADTIASDTDLKSDGDSVHAVWNVRWVQQPCGL